MRYKNPNARGSLQEHWEKSKPMAKIELKDYSKEINCKPYPWTVEDKEEFVMYINEMKKIWFNKRK